VRLEAAARPGQIVADALTFSSLPPGLQTGYGPEETVHGKRAERFPAHRCTVLEYSGSREERRVPGRAAAWNVPIASMDRIPRYALISLGAFLCCLLVLLLLIANADKLTALGLTEHVYYLVLVLMGLAAAAFLFGVLPSSAAYEGTVLGGTLKLSGAVVGAALVVFGFYFLVPKTFTFPLTVYVHGQGGPQDIVLRNSGRVVLELGPEPSAQPIGENGQAYFPAVPANFRGQEVPAWVESEAYESVDPRAKHRLEGTSLYLVVQRKILRYTLGGTVSDSAGNPLPGVRVMLPEYHVEVKTNDQGRFDLQVVAEGQRMVELVAQKQGYRIKHLSPTLGDPGFNFSLERSP
jgi:hypothetical protein